MGGPDQCTVCGAVPTHQTIEDLDTTNFDLPGDGSFESLFARYCAAHEPQNAMALEAPARPIRFREWL